MYTMTKEEAKEHMRFLNGGLKVILEDGPVSRKWGFRVTQKLVTYVAPVTAENKVEKIIITFTIRKPYDRIINYHVGEYVEMLVNDLFEKCFGNVEEDEYNEFGGYCFTPEAIDFYWEITRAIPLDNLFEL